MTDVVQSIYHEVVTEEEKKEFDVTINDMPVLKCDTSLMKNVWQNLIENALKYSSKADKKKIEIGSKKKKRR